MKPKSSTANGSRARRKGHECPGWTAAVNRPCVSEVRLRNQGSRMSPDNSCSDELSDRSEYRAFRFDRETRDRESDVSLFNTHAEAQDETGLIRACSARHRAGRRDPHTGDG